MVTGRDRIGILIGGIMATDTLFQHKDGKVVVVDPSGATRALLSEVVRSLGFKDVTGVPTIKDALSIMEVDLVKWFIFPLMADQDENAMHVLQICSRYPALSGVRVSILIEESEKYCLPSAFASGLISWHSKPYTKDSITNDLSTLIKKLETNSWDTTLVAAEYLREQLIANGKYDELISFEKNMLDLYPQRAQLMLNMVLPLTKLGRQDEAKLFLRRVMLIDPSLEPSVIESATTYLGGDYKEGTKEGEVANVLGIDRVIIVDSDQSVIKNITEILVELGAKDIKSFEDGESALASLEENGNPSLIIHEWRLAKVPGPLFIQRAKARGASSSPMVLVSSLVEIDDLPFVREMGVATVVPKPIEKQILTRALVNTLMQDRSPTEQYAMERKMREFLSAKKLPEAKEMFDQYAAGDKIPNGMKKVFEAEIAWAEGHFEKARDCGIEAIKLSGDSLFVLNLLGKALMSLKDFTAASRCFEKAQSLSPLNIERLCHLAEIHSEMGDQERAEDALQKAKSVDDKNELVKEAEAKVALNGGQTERARAIMNQLSSLSNVVAYMNNQAVAWARAGQIDKGVEQYHKTIKSIPEGRNDVLAVVNYNLALAQVRAERLEEAGIYLQKCIKLGDFKVTQKAKSLAVRVQKSIENGRQIVMKSDPQDVAAPRQDGGKIDTVAMEAIPNEHKDIIAKVMTRKGDLGCFMVYHVAVVDTRARALFSNPPRFNVRQAIERKEAFGVDRLQKSGS